MKQRLALGLFLCLALVQLAVPASMLVRRELTLQYGRQYRFQTAPVDPYDPFRGRYVALALQANTAPTLPGIQLTSGQRVYAMLTEDAAGFATIASLSLTPLGVIPIFRPPCVTSATIGCMSIFPLTATIPTNTSPPLLSAPTGNTAVVKHTRPISRCGSERGWRYWKSCTLPGNPCGSLCSNRRGRDNEPCFLFVPQTQAHPCGSHATSTKRQHQRPGRR